MNIKVLTPQESLEYYNKVREENKSLTPHQIEHWIKSISITGGNTGYIIGEENWQKFFKWIYTLEGQEQWQEDLDLTTYIQNWWNKNGQTTEI